MKERDAAIDIVKGICILLVVWGHLPRTGSCYATLTSLVEFLYSFHVEAFILLSGFLFAHKGWSIENLKEAATKLLKPYLIFSILFVALYGIIDGGFTIGGAAKRILMHGGGGALWYVYDLAFMQIIILIGSFFADRLGLKRVAVALQLIMAGLAFGLLGERGAGLCLKIVFLEYFFVGYLIGKFGRDRLPRHPLFGVIAILAALTIPYKLDQWGNLIFGVSMVGGLLWIGERIAKSKVGETLAYVGRNSFPILLMHPLAIGVMKPIYNLLLKFELTGITSMILCFLVAAVGCLGIDYILKKVNLKRYFY